MKLKGLDIGYHVVVHCFTQSRGMGKSLRLLQSKGQGASELCAMNM